MCTYVCVCVCVRMFVGVEMYRLCVHMYMYMFSHTNICTHTHKNICTHLYIGLSAKFTRFSLISAETSWCWGFFVPYTPLFFSICTIHSEMNGILDLVETSVFLYTHVKRDRAAAAVQNPPIIKTKSRLLKILGRFCRISSVL